jgi:hypothetical protein
MAFANAIDRIALGRQAAAFNEDVLQFLSETRALIYRITSQEPRAEIRDCALSLQQACRLLERENAKYAELFECCSSEARLTTDTHGVISDANAMAGDMLAASPAFLAKRPLISFVARQDTRLVRALIRQLRTGGAARRVTVRMRPRGQAVFPAEICGCAARGRHGGGSVAILWEIRRTG